MKENIDIAKRMREIKWTTEHTMSGQDFRKMILGKMERASKQAKLLKQLAGNYKK